MVVTARVTDSGPPFWRKLMSQTHRTRRVGQTHLEVFCLALGANVFGWTIDERQAFAVLDAYTAAGGNLIDTADVYSAWAPGNSGGESETIIGRWMASRRNRADVVIATKVGSHDGARGLSSRSIRFGVEQSLKRLGTEYIDVYFAHHDDECTAQDETVHAFDALVRDGLVRYVGASNFSADRLASSLAISREEELCAYAVLEPHYNLVHRDEYEESLAGLCSAESLGCFPYWALASGFLSGKYRRGDTPQGPRAAEVKPYLEDAGFRVLDAAVAIAGDRGVPVSAVALAWLLAQPTVTAPIASATSPKQLAQLLLAVDLVLTDDEIVILSSAGEQRSPRLRWG